MYEKKGGEVLQKDRNQEQVEFSLRISTTEELTVYLSAVSKHAYHLALSPSSARVVVEAEGRW